VSGGSRVDWTGDVEDVGRGWTGGRAVIPFRMVSERGGDIDNTMCLMMNGSSRTEE
jgi:hypothetical protein